MEQMAEISEMWTPALAVILPLDIKNYSPNLWLDWFTHFKLLTRALGFYELSNDRKVATLLEKLGDDVLPILKTLNVNRLSVGYGELVDIFNKYFHPMKSRQVFLTKSQQRSDESFEEFANRLTILSCPCRFGTAQGSLVRDVFVANMNVKYSELQATIVELPDPTMKEILQLATEWREKNGSPVDGLNGSSPAAKPLFGQRRPPMGRGRGRGSHILQQMFTSPPTRTYQPQNPPTSRPEYAVPNISPGQVILVDVLSVAPRQSLVHVAPVAFRGARNNFTEELTWAMTKQQTRPVKINPVLHEKYAIEHNSQWRRCQVAILNDDNCRVSFIDYGSIKNNVLFYRFREIPPTLVNIEPLAICVKFSHSFPTELKENQSVTLRFKNFFDRRQIWYVELESGGLSKAVREGADCGSRKPARRRSGERTPETPLGRKINQVKRHGRFPTGQQQSWELDGRESRASASSLRFCDSLGEDSQRSPSPELEGVVANLRREPDDTPPRPLRPLPIPKNAFSKVVVFYSGPEGVFLLPLNKVEERVELISTVFDAVVSSEPVVQPVVGQVLAAPFDGQFYRAQVLHVDEAAATCRVNFLDLCNEAVIDSHLTRSLPQCLTPDSHTFRASFEPESHQIRAGEELVVAPISIDPDGSLRVRVCSSPRQLLNSSTADPR